MSTLTVPIPDEDFRFLRAWTAEHGTTPEAFLAHQTQLFRERIERPLHPDVKALSGIIKGEVDERKLYHERLENEHS